MGQVGEEDRQDSVKQVERHRRAGHENRRQSKALPHHEIQRVVAGTRRHVHVRVAVVDHVQAPQRFHVVKAPMHAVLGDEVKHHNGHNELDPRWRCKQVQKSHFVSRRPCKHPHRRRPKSRVDGHGGAEENEVGTRVFPRPEPSLEQRTNALDHQVDGHARHNPHQLLPRGHRFKKVEERFHALQDTRPLALWANLQAWKVHRRWR